MGSVSVFEDRVLLLCDATAISRPIITPLQSVVQRSQSVVKERCEYFGACGLSTVGGQRNHLQSTVTFLVDNLHFSFDY